MFNKYMAELSSCKLFSGMSYDDINNILKCICPRIKKYKKNENIASAGDKLDGIGIMLCGQASIIKENVAGDRVIIQKIGAGEMFGEIAAYSKNPVWPASVEALEECEVIFIPVRKIVDRCPRLCESHNILTSNMLSIITEKALLLNRKVEFLTMKNIRGKISAYLLEEYKKNGMPVFMIPMKRNELAEFLNIPRPSLSREMCKMRDEGIIEFHRDSVRIKDVEAIKKAAEK